MEIAAVACVFVCVHVLCGSTSYCNHAYKVYMQYLCILLGKEWIKQTIVGSVLFPLLISTTVVIINFVAIYYHASRAIPFSTMVKKPLWIM